MLPSMSDDPAAHAALDRIPIIDFRKNFALATSSGRSMASMLREVVALRLGPGRLTSNEYYYYRLWEAGRTAEEKRRFVGKLAQHPMHLACNRNEWRALATDKLTFHALMRGAGLPIPGLLAIAHPGRLFPGVTSLTTPDAVEQFLRNPMMYPLFAKPISGKYSLAVLSVDGLAAADDTLVLRDAQGSASVQDVAQTISSDTGGFLIQRRLQPAAEIADAFGDRLWSVRLLVLMTPDGPLVHRTTAKIPIGRNPADNFWRAGNLIGALDPATGRVERVVRGTGDTFTVIEAHPDTDASFKGMTVPNWPEIIKLVSDAAGLLPGIGTQSWDIAVAEGGPVLLEVNFGGDLNLSQIASGRGTLDDVYHAHLVRNGYRF